MARKRDDHDDLQVDPDRIASDTVELMSIPSPTGFTAEAIDWIEERLLQAGARTSRTGKGALLATVPGGAGPSRTVVAHVDTLGAVVKKIKCNGRLALSRLGGYDWATIEGAECLVRPFDAPEVTGTVVNVKQSTHVHGPALRELKRDEATMEVRLDAQTDSADATRALGIAVGDPVAFLSQPQRAANGFVKGRHLDDKACVAILIEVARRLLAGPTPPGDVHLFVSNYEEVGHGAAAGIPADTEELLCLDMAAVGAGQTSREDAVTLCVKDASGPYDARLNADLRRLAARIGVDLVVDVYPYYASDATAAWHAGGAWRAALIGPGVDASHAFERTHEQALDATARLTLAWARS